MLIIDRSVGQRIAFYRKVIGLKQYKLAGRVGMQKESLNRIEVGKSITKLPTLVRIASELGVTLDELLGKE
ncbi:MAG TPA: helix-turn-helix transcriptional regulator [Desulfitobacteriaceae bacterium]|jgi:transcriptional regulator with XRE-family HTH domain|nr:helix-turn-helix transcriptional regulator [Desulfitobacteriaceae bacterium]